MQIDHGMTSWRRVGLESRQRQATQGMPQWSEGGDTDGGGGPAALAQLPDQSPRHLPQRQACGRQKWRGDGGGTIL